LETVLAWHLKAGMIGPFSMDGASRGPGRTWPDYFETASIILEEVEIPVRASPLQGATLAPLIGGSGSIGLLEVFHNGVSAADAAISVLFVAGAMIVLGTANAVRRALEAGIESKLLRVFGVRSDASIAQKREEAITKDRATRRQQIGRRSRSVNPPNTTRQATSAAEVEVSYEHPLAEQVAP
jgi:hypothetical protein